MCSGLQCDAALRYPRKCLLHCFRCRRHFLFQNDLARFIQNAVERPAIAEVQTNRELVSFENHVSIYQNSASLFHSRSPFLCLEHVDHWERIASRGDRPSHPIWLESGNRRSQFTWTVCAFIRPSGAGCRKLFSPNPVYWTAMSSLSGMPTTRPLRRLGLELKCHSSCTPNL